MPCYTKIIINLNDILLLSTPRKLFIKATPSNCAGVTFISLYSINETIPFHMKNLFSET